MLPSCDTLHSLAAAVARRHGLQVDSFTLTGAISALLFDRLLLLLNLFTATEFADRFKMNPHLPVMASNRLWQPRKGADISDSEYLGEHSIGGVCTVDLWIPRGEVVALLVCWLPCIVLNL